MCPFCISTAVWIAAGALTTGGVSMLAVAKFGKKKVQADEEGAGYDEQ
jgi:hypothetical protein